MEAVVTPDRTDSRDIPPIPVWMLNEYIYCSRLAYRMWVPREFSEGADTVDGRLRNRRVDRPGVLLPETEPCAVAGRGDSNFMNPYAGYLLEVIVTGKNGDIVLDGSGADGDIGKREGDAFAPERT